MTAAPLSFDPAPRVAPDRVPDEPPVSLRPAPAAQTTPADAVMLPRHIADAAYHVLQAVHALKNNGSHELFAALSKALDKGAYQVQVETAAPCDACQVRVDQGFPHHAECWSDEAVRYRSMTLPQVDPLG